MATPFQGSRYLGIALRFVVCFATAMRVANPLDVDGNTYGFLGVILWDVVTGFLCLSNSILSPDLGGLEGLVDGVV
jgi:hypothetical protein